MNPVVGETNDGDLNDMWADPIQRDQVYAALDNATGGPVAEGSVGAGTGTKAFYWKGGIGTSSRVLPDSYGGYTVGVLVQTNFGGDLRINGAPVGRELGRNYIVDEVDDVVGPEDDDGSIMVVVGRRQPDFSRPSTMRTPIRSLTEPPGFRNSHLP